MLLLKHFAQQDKLTILEFKPPILLRKLVKEPIHSRNNLKVTKEDGGLYKG